MATGVLYSYTLEQLGHSAWLVVGGPGYERYAFTKLAEALKFLSRLAIDNACIEHDLAGRPIGEP